MYEAIPALFLTSPSVLLLSAVVLLPLVVALTMLKAREGVGV